MRGSSGKVMGLMHLTIGGCRTWLVAWGVELADTLRQLWTVQDTDDTSSPEGLQRNGLQRTHGYEDAHKMPFQSSGNDG